MVGFIAPSSLASPLPASEVPGALGDNKSLRAEGGSTSPPTTNAAAVVQPNVAALLHAPELVPVKSFVNTALALKLRGNRTNYLHIVHTIRYVSPCLCIHAPGQFFATPPPPPLAPLGPHRILTPFALPNPSVQRRAKDDMETLPRLFLALAACITTVTGDPDQFKDLLAALFTYDWSGGALARGAFASLLAHLVSAKSTFLLPTLQMLARSLAAAGPCPGPGPATAAVSASTEEGAAAHDDTNEARKAAVHAALQAVLALVPAGVPELFPALAEAFPHRRVDGPGSVVNYARQLLLIAGDYAQSSSSSGAVLREKILGLLVERCLEIDVEIKIEDSGEATVEAEDAAEAVHLSAHDPSAALVLSEHVYVEDPNFILHLPAHPLAEQQQREQEQAADAKAPEEVVDGMAEKLDSVMGLLFEHLDQLLARNEKGGVRLFEGLVPTLEGPILATHRCKYVQFVLFYLAARDPTRRVPSLLIDRLQARALQDETTPLVARQAALAFLSSYLVRARGLSVEEIVRALTCLVEAAEAYLARTASDIMMLVGKDLFKEEDEFDDEHGHVYVKQELEEEDMEGGDYLEDERGDGVGQANATRHVLFYSICQAVFYVVAFHHSTVDGEDVLGVATGSAFSDVDSKDAMVFASPLAQQQGLKTRLGRLACSPLRPLDQCLESVKREFLRLAHLHGLVPTGALRGLGFAEDEEELGTHSNHNPLDSYFPFDPYLLRRSSRFVASPDVYRYWQARHASGGAEAGGHGSASVKEEDDVVSATADGGGQSDSDNSSSDESSSSSSGSSGSSGSEDDGADADSDAEREEEEEEEVVSMSVASTGHGMALAGRYWRQRSVAAEAAEKAKSRRRKRERVASMDFDEEGGFSGDEQHEEDGTDDEEEGEESAAYLAAAAAAVAGGGGASPTAAAEGAALSDFVFEAAAAAAASLARVRKESVSSVGSW